MSPQQADRSTHATKAHLPSSYGIAAPSSVASGSTVKLEILAQDYIQTVEDVAISFGVQSTSTAHDQTLGTLLRSKYLGPDESNIVGNITAYVQIPCAQPHGNATLTGALFSLIGADLGGNVEYFAINITVGDSTSSTYVTS